METNNQPTAADPGQPQSLKRTFIIGDEWLYYKFYTGPKTTDVLLAEMVKGLAQELLSNGMIHYWFFIRYSDPQLHTRVRFRVSDPRFIGTIIQLVRDRSTPYIEQNLIWKIQVDTYRREVERYGINSMELGEKWFYYDSKMVVEMLDMIEGDEGERIRWLFGLRAVDTLMEDFQLDMQQKFDLVSVWRENFGREHNMNRNLKEQLEQKFRNHRAEISELLDRGNDPVSEMLPLFELLKQKSTAVQPVIREILTLNKSNRLQIPLHDLMASYSHMMVNRLFKSKQRTHEMVLYDFLHRYYKSEIARQKYSQTNTRKKEK